MKHKSKKIPFISSAGLSTQRVSYSRFSPSPALGIFSRRCNDLKSAPSQLRTVLCGEWEKYFKDNFPFDKGNGDIILAIKYRMIFLEILKIGEEVTDKFEKAYKSAINFTSTDSCINNIYRNSFNQSEENMATKIKKIVAAKKNVIKKGSPEIKIEKEKGESVIKKITVASIIRKGLSKNSSDEVIIKEVLDTVQKAIKSSDIQWYRNKDKKIA